MENNKIVSVKYIKPHNPCWIIFPYWGYCVPLHSIAVCIYESGNLKRIYLDNEGDNFPEIDENGYQSYVISKIRTGSSLMRDWVHSKIDTELMVLEMSELIKSEGKGKTKKRHTADSLYNENKKLYKSMFQRILFREIDKFKEMGVPVIED